MTKTNVVDALLPVGALIGALLLFGVFVALGGASPVETWVLLYKGAFGDWYSWQNTLTRAAPLMLTALCVALPARAGLIIIGGEGALVLGGLAAAAVPYLLPLPGNAVGTLVVCAAGFIIGGAWIALAGALRQYRGVNETISSLLLAYTAIAIFKQLVEGPMRDPATLNKPSTRALDESIRIGGILGSDVHFGFLIGVVACLALGLWLALTASGFAVRVVGGNPRTAQLVGLPANRLTLLACGLGGGCAGLAGSIEVAAVHTNANASLIAGYGYAGILVSFIARHSPVAIIPVAILFGGFGAAGSLLQRRLGLPDASVQVLQGIAFVLILASEALRGVDWRATGERFRRSATTRRAAPALVPGREPDAGGERGGELGGGLSDELAPTGAARGELVEPPSRALSTEDKGFDRLTSSGTAGATSR